jgi:hypothetical protein
MKTTRNLALSALTIGSLALGGVNTQGQYSIEPDIYVSVAFALTATVQNPASGPDSKGNWKATTTTVKLTTANVLTLVTSARETTYPKGAYMAVMGVTVVVLDKTGANQLDDLSDLFTVTYGDKVVMSGTQNEHTGAQNGTKNGQVLIQFDDGNGTSFSITGIIKASVTETVAKDGSIKETSSYTISVAGDGTAPNPKDSGKSDPAVWTGTISGSGKGTPSQTTPVR